MLGILDFLLLHHFPHVDTRDDWNDLSLRDFLLYHHFRPSSITERTMQEWWCRGLGAAVWIEYDGSG
jgi:hypothetical protein